MEKNNVVFLEVSADLPENDFYSTALSIEEAKESVAVTFADMIADRGLYPKLRDITVSLEEYRLNTTPLSLTAANGLTG
jgi:hypothetical protein